MPSIKTTLHSAKTALEARGIPSATLDARLLLSHVLGVTRETLIAYPDRELTTPQEQQFDALLARRLAREPMAHILGTREFWGRDFTVTADTLDPRPDSETLIEATLALYHDTEKPLKIIDFGTGTGCLLLTLLAECPNAQGTAVDISPDTLSVAKSNAEKLALAKRCHFVVSNWGKEIEGSFDLIISNPPYIKKDDIQGLEPEVSIYEPKRALDGGESGLECYGALAPYIVSLLSDHGFAVLEFGAGQDEDVRAILEQAGLVFIQYKKDLAGINRCIIVRRKA